MSTIQDIFRDHGSDYLARFGNRMPAAHKKVLHAITECRSGAYGTGLYCCSGCGAVHSIPCSCGNRHCPMCQQHKAAQWQLRENLRLLPSHYFLITFTLPASLRSVLRSNQRVCYEALFSASAAALKKLAADTRFVGTSRIGMVGVLHTWGTMLQYHPHVHYIVPGGGISNDGTSWHSARQDLFVHVRPLSAIFRAKFRDAMKKTGLYSQIDPAVWKESWVVHSKAVGDGKRTLGYMARYLFRVAISNARIVRVSDDHVVFQHKPGEFEDRKAKTTRMGVLEFMRRFLQHALPAGFMKVRHFGFLNANFRLPLERIRNLVCAFFDILQEVVPPPEPDPPTRPRCPRCKATMKFVCFFPAPRQEVPSG
jgi:hypothetical protein